MIIGLKGPVWRKSFFDEKPAVACLLLFALSFALYLKTIGFDFLPSWDDGEYVLDNSRVHGLSTGNLRLIFTTAFFSLNVENAAWVSERKTLLTALFSFASLLAYVSFRERGKAGFYWLSLLLFVLAPLSKALAG